MIKFNYSNHYIDNRDKKNVLNAMSSKILTKGNYLLKFENKLKKFVKAKYCTVVSNASSALIAVLKSLDMRRKASKGGNSMDSIVLARPLKSINLTRCKLVTDAGANILASTSCSNLSVIVLSSCVHITDEFLVNLARGHSAPSLQSVNFSAIPNISDVGLVALARRCKKLSSPLPA